MMMMMMVLQTQHEQGVSGDFVNGRNRSHLATGKGTDKKKDESETQHHHQGINLSTPRCYPHFASESPLSYYVGLEHHLAVSSSSRQHSQESGP